MQLNKSASEHSSNKCDRIYLFGEIAKSCHYLSPNSNVRFMTPATTLDTDFFVAWLLCRWQVRGGYNTSRT
jgi:hypothetical protein